METPKSKIACLVVIAIVIISPLFFSCTDVYTDYTAAVNAPKKDFIDVTLITDPNLRAAIAAQLKIPVSDLDKHVKGELTVLRVDNATGNISSLVGIEQFSELKELAVFNCSITSLEPIFGLSKITSLEIQRTGLSYAAIAAITPERFPVLNSLWLGDTPSVDLDAHVSDIIALLAKLPNVSNFGLETAGLTDAQLSSLPGILGPRFLKNGWGGLSLYGNKITDASLPQIASMTNIGYLNISSNPITNLSALSSLSNLNGLNFDQTNVTDLSPLQAMYTAGAFHNNGNFSLTNCALNLRSGTANRTVINTLVSKGVSANYTQGNFTSDTFINASLIPDANLRAYIASKIGVPESALGSHYVDELTDISPNYTPGSTISSLAGLSQFTALRNIGISGQPVTSLSPLYGMNSINSLSLSGTSLNYSSLTGLTLANFPSLNSLWLGDSVDADLEFHIPEIISIFAHFPKLGGVGFENVPMTDAQFSSFYSAVMAANPTYFWNLSVSFSQLTNASLTQIAKLTNLGYLNISGTQVSDLASISSFSNLLNITLSSTKVTDFSPLLLMYNAGSFHISGCFIDVNNNNLDLRTGTANRTIINTLVSHGINVNYIAGNTVN